MFEQSPVIGPGLGTLTEHTAEIFVLLAGAFLLGVLLHWLLSRSTLRQLRQLSLELMRTKERLVAAERRPQSVPRLRESNSSEHERTLSQLRESRELEARARERIVELDGRIALLELQLAAAAPDTSSLMDPVLPFINPPLSKPPRNPP